MTGVNRGIIMKRQMKFRAFAAMLAAGLICSVACPASQAFAVTTTRVTGTAVTGTADAAGNDGN